MKKHNSNSNNQWKLKRTKQCAKCPWKKTTNPHDIPDGYSEKLHQSLSNTIAKPGSINKSIVAMSCHETATEEETYCIGWVYQQAGIGNNIGLRIRLMSCSNANEIEIDGQQHIKFEDTLP